MNKQTEEALRMAIDKWSNNFADERHHNHAETRFWLAQYKMATNELLNACKAALENELFGNSEQLGQPANMVTVPLDKLEDMQRRLKALEQPAQEPVAYRYKWDKNLQWHFSEYLAMRDYYDSEPLYTHPAQPLSDDEVRKVIAQEGIPVRTGNTAVRFARAIEKAHGIGE